MENIRAHDELKGYVRKIGIVFDDKRDERRFLDIATEELEIRIRESISSHCTEKEIDEYEKLKNAQEKKEWLVKHIPRYKAIIRKHIIKIKSEIRDNKEYIMAEKKRR